MKCICHNVYLYDIADYIIENNITLEQALNDKLFGQYCKLCIPHMINILDKYINDND